MGLKDELKKLMRPYEDEDEEYLDDDELDADEGIVEEQPRRTSRRNTEPAPARSRERSTSYREPVRSAPAAVHSRDKVVSISAQTNLQVILKKPEKFEEASGIADILRDKHAIVLNLEGTNKDVARRLLDFLSGVAYAQEGKIKKISAATYLITPLNVDIVGDLIDELESNGLYF